MRSTYRFSVDFQSAEFRHNTTAKRREKGDDLVLGHYGVHKMGNVLTGVRDAVRVAPESTARFKG
jgi:hypothetical protein